MTATAHAIVGGAIAAAVPDPSIGIPLAALSHPILDLIPHWDFGWGWKKKSKILLFAQTAADLSFGLVVTYFLFGRLVDNLYLTIAVFLSLIWDFLQAPYWLLGWKFAPFSTFYNVQRGMNGKIKLPWGILTQVATVGGVVLASRFFH
ncbi:hypothetical protein HYS96_02740 [Candidatus Daviesbacteria bacterium]|nr:hypothetical protein [Candidatus Daviesbacteria bacterium]